MKNRYGLALGVGMILVGGIGCMSITKEKKFLDSYTGRTVDQLIAMESDYRVDSLVLAFEQAIQEKKDNNQNLSQVEIDILVIEAMEREVNNGGFMQFFYNSSNEHVAILPSSLIRIGCPVASKIAADAIACLKIKGDVTPATIDAALRQLSDEEDADISERMDERYYQNKEEIANKLFEYIKAKKGAIVLK